jgi:hypothetical protein
MELRRSMDGSDVSSSSVVTMSTLATSSGTDPWSSWGFVEEEEDVPDFSGDEGLLWIPKLEQAGDMDMAELAPVSDVKESVIPEAPSSSTTPAQVKRPRGQSREHPKPTPESMGKVAKGRSKTGYITRRKQKKKCDETKPGCKLD